MSIEAQAATLAEASVIVGVHGSALTDILFAAPRALVVDLMPADLVGYRDVDPPAERWLLICRRRSASTTGWFSAHHA